MFAQSDDRFHPIRSLVLAMLIYKMIWKEKEISILGSLTYRYW